MKSKIISQIYKQMKHHLNNQQERILLKTLKTCLAGYNIIEYPKIDTCNVKEDIVHFLKLFLSSKEVEGCSSKTINYYNNTIERLLFNIRKNVIDITTDDIREYLFKYKLEQKISKTTIDNLRRIFSSFFSWLEEEDYIIKNPVRRIHKVKKGRVVKETFTDEELEMLRDSCNTKRDLSMLELLISTGIRVGELVNLNKKDVNFYERECKVFGKGESERIVYFDARTKIHLKQYLTERTDNNPALFVTLKKPYERLGITGVETRIKKLGDKAGIRKVHPHKFRRTLATRAIDKGMPIEHVQKLLGHIQIDTTMQYAMVNQINVKNAHKRYIA